MPIRHSLPEPMSTSAEVSRRVLSKSARKCLRFRREHGSNRPDRNGDGMSHTLIGRRPTWLGPLGSGEIRHAEYLSGLLRHL